MSLLFNRSKRDSQAAVIGRHIARGSGGTTITADTALNRSAVWAALRIRADLISTLPVDVFRKVNGSQVEVPAPSVIVSPGGGEITRQEWLYSTQLDLDRVGNAFGLITERDAVGNPARIDLVAHTDVVTVVKDGTVSYRIKRQTYTRDEVWHEKQFTLPGLAVGLSPIAHAAWSLSLQQSAVDFGREWFTNGGSIPSGHLKNTKKVLAPGEADIVKDIFKLSVEHRDLFVTGNDWEYRTVQAAAAEASFIETQKYTDVDAARFFGVPGDLIDANVNASAITYASITQRNLQLLIINLGPAIVRREAALNRLVAAPRFVKFNTDALVRMDPQTRSTMLIAEVAGRILAPSEARQLNNRPPFTSEQIAEFAALLPAKPTPPTVTT